jgi:regulator of RNase E activity RraA
MPQNHTIGFRIYTHTSRPNPEILASFRNIPSGNICDAMDRLGAMNHQIKPLSPNVHLSGPALTVRTRPGDNLMIWKAVDVAEPGDVLVIATYEYSTTSTFGELVVLAAKAKGLAGIVCDGMCRDASGIRATGLPVFVAGTVPSSPGKDGPGEIGGAVACGGAVVHSGDIVIGDEDGVVVVPLVDSPGVVDKLVAIREKEEMMLARIQSGQLIPAWVEEILANKGCEIIETVSDHIIAHK